MISNALLSELEKKKKPGDNDFLERAESLLAIQNTILRLQNLKSKLSEEQMTTEITSYNFLNRVRNLLSTGTQPSRRDTHADQMRRHLKHSSLDRALYPRKERDRAKFNPVEVPILDMLAVEGEKKYGWMYPSAETIRTYQDYRGLSTSMLRHCRTEEILLNGNQTEKEQRKIILWYHGRMAEDTQPCPTPPSP